MEKLKELNELKHDLIDAVKAQVAGGLENVNTEELGEVVDMIKDLAEAEEACMEACYYETVTEAMTEGEDRMGYDRWRYASGRFAPKGRGTYGYTPDTMMPMAAGYTTDRMMPSSERTETERSGVYPTDRYNARMGYDAGTVEGVIDTMGEMWSKADKATKRKMRAHVEDFMHQMSQEEL